MPVRKIAARATLLTLLLGLLPLINSCGDSTTQPNPAVCEITPASLDFSIVLAGSSSDRQITVRNTGGSRLEGAARVTSAVFHLVGDTTFSLDAGRSAVLTLRYSPAAAGSDSCVVSFTAAGCGSLRARGTGTVVAQTSCRVRPAQIDFGPVPTTGFSDRTFTLANTGNVRITGMVQANCAWFQVVSPPSGYDLAPGDSATFTVRFRPGSVGAQSCSISTGQNGCGSVLVSGTGSSNSGAVCQFDPASLDFGRVTGGSQDRTFTLANNSELPITGSIQLSCPDFSLLGAGSVSLAAHQSASYTVRFHPAVYGTETCMLSATIAGCGTLPMSGSYGGLNSCDVAPTDLDYGLLTTGQSRELTFRILNTSVQVVAGVVSSPEAGFTVENPTYSLAPGAQVTIRVTAHALGAGTRTAQLDLGTTACFGPRARVRVSEPLAPGYLKWGSLGSADGQFSSPSGVAVGVDGSVYVTDEHNDRVQKFGADGVFQASFTGFHGPAGIAADKLGDIFVKDSGTGMILRMNSSGAVLGSWQVGIYSTGLASDDSGNVYVAIDAAPAGVYKYTREGVLTGRLTGQTGAGLGVDGAGDVYIGAAEAVYRLHAGSVIATWPSPLGPNLPYNQSSLGGLALDGAGNVLVTRYTNDTGVAAEVEVLESHGILVHRFGVQGSEDGAFYYPTGIAVSPSGYVYVVDRANHRIQRFGPGQYSKGRSTLHP